MRGSFILPLDNGAGSALRPVLRSMSCVSTQPRAASWWGRATRSRTSRIRLRDINWLGDGTIEQALQTHPEVFVKVRSTRPPQAAWLREGADGGIDVELIASEDGVSPGQACAFYDAAEGQARVLGGGIIASTVAAPRAKECFGWIWLRRIDGHAAGAPRRRA